MEMIYKKRKSRTSLTIDEDVLKYFQKEQLNVSRMTNSFLRRVMEAKEETKKKEVKRK
jgi:post-segregation antitoxin (ccd killing protein)